MLGLKAGLQPNAMMEKYSGANEILQKVNSYRLAMPRYKKTFYGFYAFAAVAIIVLSLTL
ncbi:MAG: hypothetical protein OEL52_07880 [Nitrosopumilus sp.]|nr:hypothetical protein [Nitrosopumilus sp.]